MKNVVEDGMDRGLHKTFIVHPHYAFGFTRSLLYQQCIHTKLLHTFLFTQNFSHIKSEMSVEMCAVQCQLNSWHRQVSVTLVPVATIKGVFGKLVMM